MDINSWFECTVAIDQMQDDGVTRKVTQKYLVDAISFKEAEDRIIEEIAPFTSGNLEVNAVKKVRINEMLYGNGKSENTWFRIKTLLITIDERTQAEKESSMVAMVQSSSFKDAFQKFLDFMKSSLVDYRVVKIEETKILDVFKHQ